MRIDPVCGDEWRESPDGTHVALPHDRTHARSGNGAHGSGPIRGVVEDVADVRAERDALRIELAKVNAILNIQKRGVSR